MTLPGPQTGFRCSGASRELHEPREGTASTVRAFVLLECAGPWGAEALHNARLDAEVKGHLRQLEHETGIRPLLIRRTILRTDPGAIPATNQGAQPGVTQGKEPAPRGVRLYAASTRGQAPWVESVLLADVREVVDLDLTPLARGESVGLPLETGPLYFICTHGRHDVCCAERGRPAATAFCAAAPEASWEVSHIGGDRFAPNVLVLPHGLYYGGLDPETVPAFVAAHAAGRLDLDHLRGRTAYGFSVQAAEIHLRRHLGLTDIAPLVVTRHGRDGSTHRVEFAIESRRWEVEVESALGESRQLTCSSTRPGRPLRHRLSAIRAV